MGTNKCSPAAQEVMIRFSQCMWSQSSLSLCMMRTKYNGETSSNRLCRPVRFLFGKETAELTLREYHMVEKAISMLKDTDIGDTSVTYAFRPTMVDNAIIGYSAASATTCNVCGLCRKFLNLTPTSHEHWKLDNGIGNLHLCINCLISF